MIKELKAAEAQKTRSGSISTFSNVSTQSSTEDGKHFIPTHPPMHFFTAAKAKFHRKLGTSKKPSASVLQGVHEKTKPEKSQPPKKELQKSTPKIAREYIDTKWPKVTLL